MGGGLNSSRVIRGMVFGRSPEGALGSVSNELDWDADLWHGAIGTCQKVTNAKVGVFTCGIDIAQTETKGTVLLKNSEELLNFSRGEEKHMEKVRLLILTSREL